MIGPTQSEPRPNISNRHGSFPDHRQVDNTSPSRHRNYSRLYPTETAVPRTFTNRHSNLMNNCQPMPGISNPEPRPPWSHLKYSLSVVLRRACRRIFSILMVHWMFFSFNSRVTCALPFMVKISATRCSYHFMIVIWLTQWINRRKTAYIRLYFLSPLMIYQH